MRILAPNLAPFSFPSQISGLGSMLCFFFEQETPVPEDLRTLLSTSVASCSAVFQTQATGISLVPDQSFGLAAVAGSRYDSGQLMTLHYPSEMSFPTGPINTAYGQSIKAGNELLFLRMRHPYTCPGSVVELNAPLPYVLNNSRAKYASQISPTHVLARITALALNVNIATVDDPTNVVAFAVPANATNAAIPVALTSDHFNLTSSGGIRPSILATSGIAENIIERMITYAICVVSEADTATSIVPKPVTAFGLPVGETGSGSLIELFKTTLSTGEYPAVTVIRGAL